MNDIETQVIADIHARQQRGIAKYGQTLAENPADILARLQHMYEEQFDGALYNKWAMLKLAELLALLDDVAAVLDDSEEYVGDLLAERQHWKDEPRARRQTCYEEMKKHEAAVIALKSRIAAIKAPAPAPASPWPMPIHNPDNLTPEQFGDPAVWRPATPDEDCACEHEMWYGSDRRWGHAVRMYWLKFGKDRLSTCRIRRDVRDWPKGGEK